MSKYVRKSNRKYRHPTGRPSKHGAHALVHRAEVIRQFPELVRYTRDCYHDLVKDLAPEGIDTLPAAKRIILDRLLSKLQTAGLMDIYMGKHGIIRKGDGLGPLEAQPVVTVWLQVNHAIMKDLLALGLERKKLEPRVLTPQELLAAAVEDEAIEAAADEPRKGEDGGSEEG